MLTWLPASCTDSRIPRGQSSKLEIPAWSIPECILLEPAPVNGVVHLQQAGDVVELTQQVVIDLDLVALPT